MRAETALASRGKAGAAKLTFIAGRKSIHDPEPKTFVELPHTKLDSFIEQLQYIKRLNDQFGTGN